MINSLNKEAFELVKLISHKPKEKPKERVELTGSTRERGFNDWSDKIVGDMVGRTTNHTDKTIEIFLSDENGSLGFEETEYLKFESLIQKLLSLDYLNRIVTFNFIETESFNWVIDVYKKQKAESNLYDYLIASIDKKVKSKTFYFPVLNLEIENFFIVGNVEFTFFTEEYFDNLYETLKKKDKTITKENFRQIFRKDFQGQVLAKVTIKAESDKAEEIAKTYAEISVDILKLYSDSVIVPEKKTMFDLNFRLGYQVQTNFLTQEPNSLENGLAISMQFNNRPFNFSQRHYLSANQSGLKIFSDYILKKKSDELHEIIIQSIHLFGSAISSWDLHLRCVNLITILESILLKDDERGDMERKTKARLSKILTNQHREKEHIKTLFSNIYQVRHKMIHKAKRINIDFKELSEAQMMIVNLFLRLIHFNAELGFSDKTVLIEKLNEINS